MQKGHQPQFGPSKHLLEPRDREEHCARRRQPAVLWWADLLRSYTIFSPCLESPASLGNGIQYLGKVLWPLAPAFHQKGRMVGRVLTERDPDGALGLIIKKEQSSCRTQTENGTPAGRLYWNGDPSATLLLLLTPFPFPTVEVSHSKPNHDMLRKKKISSPSSCETSYLSNT